MMMLLMPAFQNQESKQWIRWQVLRIFNINIGYGLLNFEVFE